MSEYRTCPTCGQEFPLTSKFFPIHNVKGKQYLRYQCRSCWQARMREYNAKNTELKKASRKRRDPLKVKAEKQRSHARNRDKDIARSRKHRIAHSEEYRQHQRDLYYANREQRIQSAMIGTIRRMARKRSLPAKFTQADWGRALEYFAYKCAVCGRLADEERTLAMDHWIPLADPNCPGTVPTNIIPLCHGIDGCNNSKGDRDPVVWLVEYYPERADEVLAVIANYFDMAELYA